ncbi:MAG: bifunctional proline dehydrogenase/L-glutamate gamma-semialdehyde dehydrogenase PutA [Pseudomonadales bacterium]
MNQQRQQIRAHAHIEEGRVLAELIDRFEVSLPLRQQMHERAVDLVKRIREDSDPTMMELFLGEYGLSTDEGVALMCLAEALLRVPDGDTMDELIDDKITPSEWGAHLGQSHSSLINASTWALFITGKVLDEEHGSKVGSVLASAVKRLGEPIIRQAVTRVMKELGDQFVLGETITSAMKRAETMQKSGFTHSYDMLGEAARSERDAKRYHIDYAEAITALAGSSKTEDIRNNPGISIKLSALHPRYEFLQKDRVLKELMPRARSLAVLAKSANIGLNIDAEEADRLDLSLDVIDAMLSDSMLAGWDGFGVVVQAYSKRASFVIDWLYELAVRLDRRIMVRLVKGAYWDTEIKHSQVEGFKDFPVYTRKSSTDVSYICCAKQLLEKTDRLYPQFATHSAHSAAAIIELADDKQSFEFQRLHGMGEALHETLKERHDTRCRIYAPVGRHKDLLAYLVRRLLENGANSSFVSQIVDENVPAEQVAADPFVAVENYLQNAHNPAIAKPADLYMPQRSNSKGWDLSDPDQIAYISAELEQFANRQWQSTSPDRNGITEAVLNPATGAVVGELQMATVADVETQLLQLKTWGVSAKERSTILAKAADAYESNAIELFSLLIRESGKSINDCVAELREAVDFLRFYAAEGERLEQAGPLMPLGVVACISPWNFPLAIFTGQIAAALAAGNAVAAKPAETTSLVAQFAINCLHEAGVPEQCLLLLPGMGNSVGAALSSSSNVDGICFTGSTATAQHINRSMAESLSPTAPLIAETGGLNAMIVDSTALPEQAVRDILESAFQSAGQRCSALRILYVQEDVADGILSLLLQAMDELRLGDTSNLGVDIGPVISAGAQQSISAYLSAADKDGRLLKSLKAPSEGCFVGPSVIQVKGIADLQEEVFGPVLHVATFAADQLRTVVADINGSGYGLTFGMHSRIDDRVQLVVEQINAGNIYVNRNQIGAVVGTQPFGGVGLSGTGPKAGGPNYVARFTQAKLPFISSDNHTIQPLGGHVTANEINRGFQACEADTAKDAKKKNPTAASAQAIKELHLSMETAIEMPGPTGESNRLSYKPRARVLCLGPGAELASQQVQQARDLGCSALAVAEGVASVAGEDVKELGIDGCLAPGALKELDQLGAVVYWAELGSRELRLELASRDGAIIPLVMDAGLQKRLLTEQHVCIDTTAAGGNAALLAATEDD